VGRPAGRVDGGAPLDPDYNNYDSFHTTTAHPRMSRQEWMAAYRDAWESFYTFVQLRRALLRRNRRTYFVRLRNRRSRRPGLPTERRWPFFRRRIRETLRMAHDYGRLLLEMYELWRHTRRPILEPR
jgi:hypothetical protein